MNENYDRVENRKQILSLYLLSWFICLLLAPILPHHLNITLPWSPFRCYTIPTFTPSYSYTCMHYMYNKGTHMRENMSLFSFWVWVTLFSIMLYKSTHFPDGFMVLFFFTVFCFVHVPHFHYPFRGWLAARWFHTRSCSKRECANTPEVWYRAQAQEWNNCVAWQFYFAIKHFSSLFTIVSRNFESSVFTCLCVYYLFIYFFPSLLPQSPEELESYVGSRFLDILHYLTQQGAKPRVESLELPPLSFGCMVIVRDYTALGSLSTSHPPPRTKEGRRRQFLFPERTG